MFSSLLLLTVLFLIITITPTTTTFAKTFTREEIYAQAGFVRNWVAPMPSSPILAAGASNSSGSNDNTNGEKFLVQNWSTTFHSIQVGGNDISFVDDPFAAPKTRPGPVPASSAAGAKGSGSASSSTSGSGSGGQESSQVLQLNYPKGSYAPSIGPITGGAHFYAKPFGDKTPFSKMMISYDVAFPNGFDWVLGGKLPGVYGGTPYEGCSGGAQSTGANCLTMRLMWRPSGIGEVYAYVPADPRSNFCKSPQVICNDQYGKSIGRGQIYFQPGTWTRLDMVMTLNEPAGRSNGTLQVYMNGNQVVALDNISYRSTGMVGFQGLLFSSFFGGSDSTYATPVDTEVYFRNVQMSVGEPITLYSGPGKNGAGRVVGGVFGGWMVGVMMMGLMVFL